MTLTEKEKLNEALKMFEEYMYEIHGMESQYRDLKIKLEDAIDILEEIKDADE